jgi:hypothetical protein
LTPAAAAGQVVPPARLSVSTAGTQSNGPSQLLATTPTGRFVLFSSQGSTLVEGDTNGVADLFVRDRDTDGDGRLDEPGAVATVRVSVGSFGAQADRAVETGVMSDNGRWIVFSTEAGTLVTGDTNGVADVFVRDRDADGNGHFDEPGGVATARMSEGTGGREATGASTGGTITPDGRYVLFLSTAANLSTVPSGTIRQVYRKDRQTGELVLVSSTAGGVPADAPCELATISASGEVAAFRSEATNLAAGGGPGLPGVFVRDLATGLIERHASGAGPGTRLLLAASVPRPGIRGWVGPLLPRCLRRRRRDDGGRDREHLRVRPAHASPAAGRRRHECHAQPGRALPRRDRPLVGHARLPGQQHAALAIRPPAAGDRSNAGAAVQQRVTRARHAANSLLRRRAVSAAAPGRIALAVVPERSRVRCCRQAARPDEARAPR